MELLTPSSTPSDKLARLRDHSKTVGGMADAMLLPYPPLASRRCLGSRKGLAGNAAPGYLRTGFLSPKLSPSRRPSAKRLKTKTKGL
jgi:hypothetical protein